MHGSSTYAVSINTDSSLSGEFGIVYKGYIKKGDTNSLDEYLAIKTLKGACTHTFIDLLKT